MDTVRLTAAQAIVRFLVAQRTVVDGREAPLFPGVFAIFGHGNVTGLGNALDEAREELPVYRGQNEQGMALAAVAFAKATRRRQIMVATSSIGPGATNMVTAAGAALANRLPLLLLCGDTFQSRVPDPVLQQVEHLGAPSTTVNDAFRAVTRYWDRIVSRRAGRAEPAARGRDDARPGRLRAGVPRAAAGRPGRRRTTTRFGSSSRACTSCGGSVPTGASSPRRPRALRGGPAPGADRGRRRPLLARRGRAPRVRRAPRPAGGRDDGGQGVPHGRPPMLGRAGRRHRLRPREPARRRGGRRPGGRDPPAGLHDRLVDGVRRGDPHRRAQRGPVRRDEAPLGCRSSAMPASASPSSAEALGRTGAPTRQWAARAEDEATAFRAFVAERTGGWDARTRSRRTRRSSARSTASRPTTTSR